MIKYIELSSPDIISPTSCPKAQPSRNVKASSYITDLAFRFRFEPCVTHSIVLEFIPNYAGGHLLLTSYLKLYRNSFLNLLLFHSPIPGIMPIHFLLKHETIFSSFILLAILQSWHLISASNYLVSSILLLIFFEGVKIFKIALWSAPKHSQLSQNMNQIIPRDLSLENKAHRNGSKFLNFEFKASNILPFQRYLPSISQLNKDCVMLSFLNFDGVFLFPLVC